MTKYFWVLLVFLFISSISWAEELISNSASKSDSVSQKLPEHLGFGIYSIAFTGPAEMKQERKNLIEKLFRKSKELSSYSDITQGTVDGILFTRFPNTSYNMDYEGDNFAFCYDAKMTATTIELETLEGEFGSPRIRDLTTRYPMTTYKYKLSNNGAKGTLYSIIIKQSPLDRSIYTPNNVLKHQWRQGQCSLPNGKACPKTLKRCEEY